MFKVPLLAKITLLSYSVPEKAVIALGYIDILVLLRSLSITNYSPKIWVSICWKNISKFSISNVFLYFLFCITI